MSTLDSMLIGAVVGVLYYVPAVGFYAYAGLVRLFIWATEPRHQRVIDEFDLQIALAKVRTGSVPSSASPEPPKEVVIGEPKPPA